MNLNFKFLILIFSFSLVGISFVGFVTYNSGKNLNILEMQDLLAALSKQVVKDHPPENADIQEWKNWVSGHKDLVSAGVTGVLFDQGDALIATTANKESRLILEHSRVENLFLKKDRKDPGLLHIEDLDFVWDIFSIGNSNYSLAVFYLPSADRFSFVVRRLVVPTLIAGGFALWVSVWAAIVFGNLIIKTRREEFQRAQKDLELKIEERTAELSQSEELFRDISEATTDRFWEMDETLHFTSMFGYPDSMVFPPAEQLIGKTHWEMAGVDPDKDEKWRKHRDDLLAHRPFRDFEFTIEDEDGVSHYRSASGKPVFDKNGIFRGYRGSATDITELKQAENELVEKEAQLRLVTENIPGGVCLLDSDLNFVFCNEQYKEMFGFPDGLIEVGKSIEDAIRFNAESGFHGPGEVEEQVASRMEALRSQEFSSADRFLPNGRTLHVNHAAISGFGIATIVTDITDQKRAQEALKAAKAEAEAANSAKSEFLAAMSHDLRTPLNAIQGFSEMLKGQYFGPLGSEKYQEYANDIHTSSQYLVSLVSDILDLTIIESSKRDMVKAPVFINNVIRDCLPMIEHSARGKKIELGIQAEDDMPVLIADLRSISQILINLLSNAVKYTDEGGKVTLKASANNASHILKIIDTGRGIPEDKIDTLTDPFVRTESDPHLAQEGTGLGLTIVKALTEMHGGTLDIKSKIGKGTTVTVTLPNSVS